MPDIVLRIDYCDVKVIAKNQKLDHREITGYTVLLRNNCFFSEKGS